MKKLITAGILIAVVAAVAWRNWSYICVFHDDAQKAIADAIPTEVELKRVRLLIANMDTDIKAVESSVAGNMADRAVLKSRIEAARANLSEQKKSLLTMTSDLEVSPKGPITYDGKDYSAEQIRHKLDRDFVSYKQGEQGLKTLEQTLQHKDREIAAGNTQRDKLLTLKGDATKTLDRLIADQRELEAARLSNTKIEVNTSRIKDAQDTLERIEHRQAKERAEIAFQTQRTASENIPVTNRSNNEVSLEHIRQYLEQPQTTGTTSKKTE